MGEVASAVSADLWDVACKCAAEIPVSLWKAASALQSMVLQSMVLQEAAIGFQEAGCIA
jgi:hypothetical protein